MPELAEVGDCGGPTSSELPSYDMRGSEVDCGVGRVCWLDVEGGWPVDRGSDTGTQSAWQFPLRDGVPRLRAEREELHGGRCTILVSDMLTVVAHCEWGICG